VVARTAFDYERRVKEQMAGPKTGRIYRRSAITRADSPLLPKGLRRHTTEKGNTRVTVGYRIHQASAPGEAPAIDLGQLLNSSVVTVDGMSARVAWTAEYAADLEYGTSRMLPRPFAEPEAEKIEPVFIERLSEAVTLLCE